jgi:hypothetical protein
MLCSSDVVDSLIERERSAVERQRALFNSLPCHFGFEWCATLGPRPGRTVVRHSAPTWITFDIELGRDRNVPLFDPNGKRARDQDESCKKYLKQQFIENTRLPSF